MSVYLSAFSPMTKLNGIQVSDRCPPGYLFVTSLALKRGLYYLVGSDKETELPYFGK